MAKPGARPRGRPKKSFDTDRDRYAIALAEALRASGLSQSQAYRVAAGFWMGREAADETLAEGLSLAGFTRAEAHKKASQLMDAPKDTTALGEAWAFISENSRPTDRMRISLEPKDRMHSIKGYASTLIKKRDRAKASPEHSRWIETMAHAFRIALLCTPAGAKSDFLRLMIELLAEEVGEGPSARRVLLPLMEIKHR